MKLKNVVVERGDYNHAWDMTLLFVGEDDYRVRDVVRLEDHQGPEEVAEKLERLASRLRKIGAP